MAEQQSANNSASVEAAVAASAATPVEAASSSSSSSARPHPPSTPQKRVLTAAYDDEGIYCYQAYTPSIGEEAARRQSFKDVPGFSPTRMTWIKFSLGWMLYRCDYARARSQETVLRIKLSWAAFDRILASAVGSTWNRGVHPTREQWQAAMAASDVRFQWDPERDLHLRKFAGNQRALQLGLSKEVGRAFATDPSWILSIENCTEQVKRVLEAVEKGTPMPDVPVEREFVIEQEARRKSLAMDGAAEEEHGPVAAVNAAAAALLTSAAAASSPSAAASAAATPADSQ